ncbi:hypothetical protein P3T27_002149 [Kitasatospora sp. MAA19]|uniref:hypothetical protein n=1 Tax=Kitasatospora sp. MAA19 TaxID=3035090 RepID=UPI00247329A3|nr:hypothetical protein [Kitasatospora sp. MAA19]MDH6705439.1 hypothetical protein [Kitasatospora sp. MAA19]
MNEQIDSGPPSDLVEAGNELHQAVQYFLEHRDDPSAAHDIYYAQEKLSLAVTGWAHWDTPAGRGLNSQVGEIVSSLRHDHGKTLADLRAALDELNAL